MSTIDSEQAKTELGQAQLKLGLDFATEYE